MWRPKDWQNPYRKHPMSGMLPTVENTRHVTYEIGADAMLKGLIDKLTPLTSMKLGSDPILKEISKKL